MNKTSLKNILLYFVLLLPFFEPTYISANISRVDKIYEILLVISCAIVLCINLKKAYISKFTVITIIFEIILIFVCVINNNFEKSIIISAVKIIGITLLVNYGVKNNCKEILKAIVTLFELLIAINFITIILFPNGMYVNQISGMTDNWFLGMDNTHVLYFLPLIMLIYVYYKIYKKITIVDIISIIICVLSILMRWSATTVVGMTLIGIYILLERIIGRTKIFNMYSYTVSYFIIYFGIIIFRIQEKFAFLIENVLKKDVTFTKRTQVWDSTIELIKENPIIGYGVEDSKIRLQKIGVMHAHNIFLEIIYQGGIILLGVFLYMIYEVLKKLQKNYGDNISRVLMFSIFTLFIMMITEAYNLFNIIFILSICNSIDYFIQEKKKWSNKCKEPKKVSLI